MGHTEAERAKAQKAILRTEAQWGACAGGRSADTQRKPGSQTRARRARQPQTRKPGGAGARAQARASARRDPRSASATVRTGT
eukprot:11044493-Alexandrium_andersonii.AAC.1